MLYIAEPYHSFVWDLNGASNNETWFLKGFVNTLLFSKIKGDAAGV